MNYHSIFRPVLTAMMAVFASIMMTSTAVAHPGHDHTANESMLMHVLFYGSAVAALTACAWFVYRQFKQQKNDK